MPIGDNQLNILLFEVGFKKRITDPFLGTVQSEKTLTTGIHPLLVAPRKITYVDASRTPVLQTTGGALETVSGRALRQVRLEGTFGVDNRGLLLYLGNGEIRFKRFYKEVVRMGDAITQDEVDANEDILNGTPGIPLLLKAYDEDDSTFYLNWYDFWNDITFEARVRSFNWWREHRNGGAQGMVHYSMQLDEVGPIVTGNLTSTLINGFLQALTLVDSLNNVLASYTLGNLLESIVNVAAPVLAEFEDALEGIAAQGQLRGSLTNIKTQIESVKNLMSGQGTSSRSLSSSDAATAAATVPGTSTATSAASVTASSSSAGASALATLEAQAAIASFFSNARSLASAASTVSASISSELGSFDAETGQIDWGDALVEGGSSDLYKFDELVAMLDVEEAAEFQQVYGVLFGMDRETYRAYVEAGGASSQQAPELSGSIKHVMTETDTPDELERTFNVSFARILAVNRLTPDELLIPGTEIEIPRVRARGAQGIEGLPTFGSHVGQEAWGVDLRAEMAGDGSLGDIAVLSGPDVLEQGAEYLIDVFGEELLNQLDQVPDQTRVSFITKQLNRLFRSDQRIAGISEVSVDVGDVSVDVQVTVSAINGGTIRTGGS